MREPRTAMMRDASDTTSERDAVPHRRIADTMSTDARGATQTPVRPLVFTTIDRGSRRGGSLRTFATLRRHDCDCSAMRLRSKADARGGRSPDTKCRAAQSSQTPVCHPDGLANDTERTRA
jgi:hypothetical protein